MTVPRQENQIVDLRRARGRLGSERILVVVAELSCRGSQVDDGVVSSAFHVAVPAQGTCAGGTAPVYRLWNGQANAAAWGSNHRYTTSPAIVSQMVGEGYVNEGVVMCSPN